jgi:hypothetical protein
MNSLSCAFLSLYSIAYLCFAHFSHLKAGVPVTDSTYKRSARVHKRTRNKQRTAERFDEYTRLRMGDVMCDVWICDILYVHVLV